jgi:hypothetical protein
MKMDFATLALEPPDDSEVIWRYTNLLNLVPELQWSQLTLIRIDQFSDKYEGSIPIRPFMRGIMEVAAANKGLSSRNRYPPAPTPDELAPLQLRIVAANAELAERKKALHALYQSVYANCWHCGKESEAMWRLYCRDPGGVAISSTFGKLKRSLGTSSLPLTFTKIRYIDYSKDEFPDENLAYAVIRKRDAFDHETELRVLWFDQHAYDVAFSDPSAATGSMAIQVPFNFVDAIDGIRTSPYDDPRHSATVVGVIRLLNSDLASRVKDSDLRGIGWRG